MDIINWVISNGPQIIQAYLAIVGAASLVIKLTPTVKDDAWLKKYLRFTGKFISLNKTLNKK